VAGRRCVIAVTDLDILPVSALIWRRMVQEVEEAAEVGEAVGEEVMMEAACAIAVTGLDILPVSALRERGATREEVGGQFVTVVTEWDTLPGSALKEREMM